MSSPAVGTVMGRMAELANAVNVWTDEWTEAGALLDMIVRGRPAWQRDALCREHPELTWFPELGQTAAPAKRLCRDCLVYSDCRRWSLEQGHDLEGVWGGLSKQDRRTIRVERAA
jgi:hypothetical protein